MSTTDQFNKQVFAPFPDPRKLEYLNAPFGPGVYELVNGKTGEKILVGMGKNPAFRMSSLLPTPFGQGTRKNNSKSDYVFINLSDVLYRTLPCNNAVEAKILEKLLQKANKYLFHT